MGGVGEAEEPAMGMIGAVGLVMGKPEGRLDRPGERGAQQGPAVVPAALMPGLRSHAHGRQLVCEAEPMQHARGVRADLNPGTHLAELTGLLVDVYVQPGPKQRERGGEPADAAADHADPQGRPSRIAFGQIPDLPGARMPFGSSASLIVSLKRL